MTESHIIVTAMILAADHNLQHEASKQFNQMCFCGCKNKQIIIYT